MRAYTIVHINAGTLPVTDLLHCDQDDNRVSYRIVDGDNTIVWLTGTHEQFDQLAVSLRAIAQNIRLTGYPSVTDTP